MASLPSSSRRPQQTPPEHRQEPGEASNGFSASSGSQSSAYSFRVDPQLLDDRPPFLGIGLTSAPSASGVCCSRGKISRPRSASRDRTAGSASASTAAALSLAMMSFGVPLGAKNPNQVGEGKRRQSHLGKSRDVGRLRQARVACYRIGFYAPGPHQRQLKGRSNNRSI